MQVELLVLVKCGDKTESGMIAAVGAGREIVCFMILQFAEQHCAASHQKKVTTKEPFRSLAASFYLFVSPFYRSKRKS